MMMIMTKKKEANKKDRQINKIQEKTICQRGQVCNLR